MIHDTRQEFTLRCDRCSASQSGYPPGSPWVSTDASLTEGPGTFVEALCPDCAAEDDPHHPAGNWLLKWA